MRALGALLLRDLRGASRAGTPAWARALAAAGAGLAAVAALARLGPAYSDEVSDWFAGCLLALMGLCLASALSFALGAFRAEREAGTLDLLLLAGLRPSVLVTGRILSSFVVLLSIAAAALPGLALFRFFRTPDLATMGGHLVALASFALAVAALAVAISAWSRRPGPALAASLFLLPGFGLLSMTPDAMRTWSAPGLVRWLGDPPASGLSDERVALTVGSHLLLAVVAALVARLGLERGPGRPVGSPKRARRTGSAPSVRRPLSWLFRRSSPAARPGLQLAALLLGFGPWVAVAAWRAAREDSPEALLEPLLLSPLGGAAGLIAVAIALTAGSTRIAALRERRAWESIASTAQNSERLFLDLLSSTVSCCLVPFAGAALLLVAAELARGRPFQLALAPAVSLLASLLLAAVLGLAASACARSSTAAIALASVFLLGLPSLVTGLLLAGGSGLPGEAGGWLLRLVFLGLVLLPLLIRGPGPFALLLLRSVLDRHGASPRGPGSLLVPPLLVLVPLALLMGLFGGLARHAWAIGFGGLHSSLIHVATWGEERSELEPSVLLGGAQWQALFALLVLASLWKRRDLWLGRAER